MTQTTIKGITYNIKAEVELTGASGKSNYKSILILIRPKGVKEFMAMRDINGEITIN